MNVVTSVIIVVTSVFMAEPSKALRFNLRHKLTPFSSNSTFFHRGTCYEFSTMKVSFSNAVLQANYSKYNEVLFPDSKLLKSIARSLMEANGVKRIYVGKAKNSNRVEYQNIPMGTLFVHSMHDVKWYDMPAFAKCAIFNKDALVFDMEFGDCNEQRHYIRRRVHCKYCGQNG